MNEYVYPKDVLPEMEYDEPLKQKSCGNCLSSKVTNPGAHHPGLECKVMRRLFASKGIENGNGQVDWSFGSCKFYNMTWKAIEQVLSEKENG